MSPAERTEEPAHDYWPLSGGYREDYLPIERDPRVQGGAEVRPLYMRCASAREARDKAMEARRRGSWAFWRGTRVKLWLS